MSIIALAQPADAEVVYKPAHVTLTYTHSYSLDLNGDGVADFVLRDGLFGFDTGFVIKLNILAQVAGNVAMAYTTDDGLDFASALKSGAQIGPVTGKASPYLAAFYSDFSGRGSLGPWANVKNCYLGLRFQINGKPHFGWARLSVLVNQHNIDAYLTGYAYETIPGKGIVAGQTTGTADDAKLNPQPSNEDQPASLGKLALGAAKPGAVQIPTEKAE